jgi:hypothetical protein
MFKEEAERLLQVMHENKESLKEDYELYLASFMSICKDMSERYEQYRKLCNEIEELEEKMQEEEEE